jgi:hypothetical protein
MFCRDVLKVSNDKYDLILVAFIIYKIQFTELYKTALNILIETVNSRIIEEPKVKEAIFQSFKLIPKEIFEKSKQLIEYIDKLFKLIDNVEVDEIYFEILSACCTNDKIFLKFIDWTMNSLKSTLILPSLSNTQTEWLLLIMATLKEVMNNRTDTMNVLMILIELFPKEITDLKLKKLAKVTLEYKYRTI